MFTIRHLSAGVSALFLCATTFAADLPRQELIEKGKRGTALVLTESESRHWTAFCIDGSGLFITSERAVGLAGDPRRVSVVINAGEANQKTLLGRVVRADKNLDLALVRVEDAGKLSELEMGNSDSVVETSMATIFGFPTGKIRGDFASVSVKSGEVMSLVKSKGKLQYFVLEGAVTPPWAGAPALDSKGKVIGVVKYPSLPAPVEFGGILRTPSGGTGAGACTILPVNDLAEWLAAPDIVFDPLPVSRERASEPRDFHVRVVTWKKAKGELSLEFTVSTGKGDVRTYKGQLVEEGRFKVSAPLFPAEGSARRVPLTVRFEEGSVACSVKDMVFKVGEREVRLSELRRLEAAESPDEKATVTLEDGDRIRGVVSGLKSVEAELGGATSQVNLGKAISITVEPQFAARVRSVDYKVVVKQDGKVANTVEGVVNILEPRREREDEVVARGGGSELVFADRTAHGVVPHDEAFLPGRGDFSVVVFFKSSTPPRVNCHTITKTTSGLPSKGWSMGLMPSVAFFECAGKSVKFATRDVFNNRWHSQIMVRRDGFVKCYVDGEEVGTFDSPGAADDRVDISLGHLTIPHNHDATFVGSIKQCSYWNRALTARDVADIASGALDLRGKERGLVAYWPMDEGRGARFKDFVGGYHGTMKGDYRWKPDLSADDDRSDGLMAHWKFDENRGSIIRDSGPYGLDGRLTEVDEPDDAWEKGILGTSIELDGKKNYITIRSSEDILNPGTRDWTITAWIKTTRGEGGMTSMVYGKNQGSGKGLVLGVVLNDSKTTAGHERVYFEAGGPNRGFAIHGKTVVTDGRWHHIAGTRSGSTLRVYVDGVLEAEKTDDSVGENLSSDAVVQLGRYGLTDGWASPRFRGNIDDVRVYKRALSRREIEALTDRKELER